ncbi:MAG: TonB-dependent receptor plug domain-containing protein, partial [Bacteroidota bacterium]
GIYVRGGAPDQNLVLWNGIKIYDQGHLFGMLSAFNPYMVEKVDFIKQGTSAYYGDRVSGIIDIQTNQEVLKETEGGAGFDMIYSDINFKAPIIKEKLAVQGAVRRSFTDLLATPTYDRLSDRVFQNTKITNEASINNPGSTNKFFFNDLNFDLIAQPNPGEKWMTSILITENDLDFSSANTTNQTSFRDLLRTVNIGYNLRWERQLHDQLLLSSNIYHSQHLLDYQFENKVNDTVEVSSKKNLISDFGASLNADWTFENGNALSSGYQFSTNRMRHAFETKAPSYELVLDAADKTINTHSFHSEYEYLQSEKTYLSAGLRFNYYTGVEKYFIEPRLYMKYQIGRSLALNTSVEYRSQVATQIQESIVSDLSLENQVWTLAGEDQFPVIDSYQFTIGSSFTQNKWLIDADTYLKKINGITTLTFGFLNPIDNEYRVGSSSITGLDLFIKRKFSRYHTWFSYSFIHSENEFTGLNNDQPFPGNWNIEHTIKWSHFYQWKSIHFTVGWIWHTGKAFTEITENPTSQGPLGIQFAGINSSNLPPYHRLDFSVIYNFHFRKNQKVNYRIGLSIQNVYNRKNLLNQEFRTTPTLENELISTNIYSLSFTPNLVFRVFW